MNAVQHGGALAEMRLRFPDAPDPWLDLSTGLNPRPWPWTENIPATELQELSANLPDNDLTDYCRTAWTEYLETPEPENWVLAAGSQAIINLLPQLFPKHSVCLADPTYGEHVRVWQNARREVIRFSAKDLSCLALVDKTVLILTNPNNPDGHLYDPAGILHVAARLQSTGGYLVVDEAFCDSLPRQSLANRQLPANLVLMRSLGKFFGLAGLRIGLCRGAPPLQQKLQSLLGPWPVNSLALRIACQALRDKTWIEQTRTGLQQDGKRLQQALTKAGLEVIGSTDLFCLVRSTRAADIAQMLAHRGIYVRTFLEDNQLVRFGLPLNSDGFDRLEHALEP